MLLSAFGSAGQRCSALRVLFLQEEIAEKFLKILSGAMQMLRVGLPENLSTDIGPVIDQEALSRLRAHEEFLARTGRMIARVPLNSELTQRGFFFAPAAYEIADIDQLKDEVFGPILHVIRYKEENREVLVEQINRLGYGLTFGVQSRIGSVQKELALSLIHI